MAASELIKTNVEPLLEQYRPIVLSSLTFSKLTLGILAPQFTGVSVVEDESEGITLELEMNWDGNPNIILDVKTRLGVGLPVQDYAMESDESRIHSAAHLMVASWTGSLAHVTCKDENGQLMGVDTQNLLIVNSGNDLPMEYLEERKVKDLVKKHYEFILLWIFASLMIICISSRVVAQASSIGAKKVKDECTQFQELCKARNTLLSSEGDSQRTFDLITLCKLLVIIIGYYVNSLLW